MGRKKKQEQISQSGHEPIPGELTTEELQWFYPVTARMLGKKIQKGIIQRLGNDKFPTAETLRALIEDLRGKSEAGERIKSAKAEMAEMELAEMKKDLISREEQEDWQRAVVGNIANELEGMPANGAKLFPEIDRDDAQERLSTLSDGMRENLFKLFKNYAENPEIKEE